MNIKLKSLKLLNTANIEKAYLYTKTHGVKALLRRTQVKLSETAESPLVDLPSSNDAPSPTENEGSPATSFWDDSLKQYQTDNFKLYWELLREIQKDQCKKITGHEEMDFLTFTLNYCRENFASTGLRALWIGCMEGNPGPEVLQFESGIFDKIEVMDIAEGLLRKQRQLTADRGITGIEYIRQDFNEVELEANAYDIIFSVGTIHHVEKLELIFEQINKALKKQGKFMIRDYIGPNRVQFTDLQLAISNEILSILPEKYKKKLDGSSKDIILNCDLDLLMKDDPSEAIRSQDILEVMKERLDIIKLSYLGGTILFPLMSEIASNFEQDQDAETILKLLIFFERIMIDNSMLPSDYVFCIAQKKQSVG